MQSKTSGLMQSKIKGERSLIAPLVASSSIDVNEHWSLTPVCHGSWRCRRGRNGGIGCGWGYHGCACLRWSTVWHRPDSNRNDTACGRGINSPVSIVVIDNRLDDTAAGWYCIISSHRQSTCSHSDDSARRWRIDSPAAVGRDDALLHHAAAGWYVPTDELVFCICGAGHCDESKGQEQSGHSELLNELRATTCPIRRTPFVPIWLRQETAHL